MGHSNMYMRPVMTSTQFCRFRGFLCQLISLIALCMSLWGCFGWFGVISSWIINTVFELSVCVQVLANPHV